MLAPSSCFVSVIKRIAFGLEVILILISFVLAQDVPHWIPLLSRIRNHIREQSEHLVDVSCLETIEREYRPAKGKFQSLDTVTLEVLTLGSRELFASPGARNFSDEQPIKYVGSGMISNGIVASYLHDAVLANEYVTTEYKGEEYIGERRLVRFDYKLPLLWSGQTIHTEEGTGNVSLHGSYWADTQTYDVVRLDVNAGDIPPNLPLRYATTRINYAPTRLGDVTLLMPQSADVRLVKYSGEIKHNRVEFTQWRRFKAETAISFGDPKAPEPRFGAITVDDQLRSLPGGLRISVLLRTHLTSETPVGTLIEGAVAADVSSRKASVFIPAGSLVHGRLRRLERSNDPLPHFVVGLEFTEIELQGVRHRFYADLTDIQSAPGIDQTLSTSTDMDLLGIDGSISGFKETKQTVWLPKLPGVATFFYRGSKFDLPNDFRTDWKTRRPQ